MTRLQLVSITQMDRLGKYVAPSTRPGVFAREAGAVARSAFAEAVAAAGITSLFATGFNMKQEIGQFEQAVVDPIREMMMMTQGTEGRG